MVLIIIGIAVSFIGIFISFYIHWENKKLVLKEKKMIFDKIADIKTTLQSHLDELEADQKKNPAGNLDTVGIRQEKIKAMIEILSRFEKRLKKMKIK